MTSADIILGSVSDTTNAVSINDYNAFTEGTPSLDTSLGGTNDILNYAGTQSNGVTTIKFRRYLNTNDIHGRDYVIDPEDSLTLIFAYQSSTDDLVQHSSMGSFRITSLKVGS